MDENGINIMVTYISFLEGVVDSQPFAEVDFAVENKSENDYYVVFDNCSINGWMISPGQMNTDIVKAGSVIQDTLMVGQNELKSFDIQDVYNMEVFIKVYRAAEGQNNSLECEEENLVFQAGPYAISSKTTPQKASSVSGTPVYEGNGIRVTLAGKSEGPFGDDLLLYVENNTDIDIYFTSYTDYDSPSYDFDAPMVIAEADVLAHKKAECHLAMMYTDFDYGKEWVITGNEKIETPFAAYDLKNHEEPLFTTESVTIDTSKLSK